MSQQEHIILVPPVGLITRLPLSLDMTLAAFYMNILWLRFDVYPEREMYVMRRGHCKIRLDHCSRQATLRQCGLMENDSVHWSHVSCK